MHSGPPAPMCNRRSRMPDCGRWRYSARLGLLRANFNRRSCCMRLWWACQPTAARGICCRIRRRSPMDRMEREMKLLVTLIAGLLLAQEKPQPKMTELSDSEKLEFARLQTELFYRQRESAQ